MICVEMFGRLGNQMFRYAFARALQEKNHNEPMLFSFRQVNDRTGKDSGWENSLRFFRVKPFQIYNGNHRLMLAKTSLIQKLLCAYYRMHIPANDPMHMEEQFQIECKYQPLLNKHGIYWLHLGYYPVQKSHAKNKLISGSFESSAYFDDIRGKLLEEFTPLNPPLVKNEALYQKILLSNSVCVTVRRGDFVNNQENKKIHDVCPAEYFYRGMDVIHQKVQDPYFVVFSDDIDWVRNNMQFQYPVVFESGSDPVWEKLRLMYSCKHFVISNSTFSWWAQYLSRNPHKIVVSPNRWYNTSFHSPLILEDFIVLPV